MKEKHYYTIIKKLVDSNGNKKRAAITLNCSLRHINRLEEVPIQETESKEFSLTAMKKEPQKKYIPKMSHPWRQNIFKKFVEEQSYETPTTFEEVINSTVIRN